MTGLDLPLVLAHLQPAVLIDARMRRHHVPEDQRHLAPLTIGLGPNFAAGAKVIEVDPRGRDAEVFGIGARQNAIAQGVLRALQSADHPAFAATGA